MSDQEEGDELLMFFKALADENRLKIVGLLATQSFTVEKLAEALGLGVSTTSHHLSKLSKVGLVSARTDGHYYIYSLHTDRLRAMAQHLLKTEELPRLNRELSADAFDQKVLDTFIDREGRIKSFPAQAKKYVAILRFVVKAFEPGVRYSEKQVNEILGQFNEDTASLRRDLVDFHLMDREGGGGEYWRLE